LSIGGVKSSSQLSAVSLHNLFDRVTGDEALNGVTRYRCLYFVNVDSDAEGFLDPVSLYFSALPTNGDLITMGLSAQGKNANATVIANENTTPAGVSFSAPISRTASTLILPEGPYLQNDYIGVWFAQEIPPEQITSVSNTIMWVVVGDTV
jgi:hypothetical protein